MASCQHPPRSDDPSQPHIGCTAEQQRSMPAHALYANEVTAVHPALCILDGPASTSLTSMQCLVLGQEVSAPHVLHRLSCSGSLPAVAAGLAFKNPGSDALTQAKAAAFPSSSARNQPVRPLGGKRDAWSAWRSSPSRLLAAVTTPTCTTHHTSCATQSATRRMQRSVHARTDHTEGRPMEGLARECR